MVCEPNQKPAACPVGDQRSYGACIELKVNGKEIELNSFAQNTISQTVIGMVRSLRGVGDIENISLKVSRKEE